MLFLVILCIAGHTTTYMHTYIHTAVSKAVSKRGNQPQITLQSRAYIYHQLYCRVRKILSALRIGTPPWRWCRWCRELPTVRRWLFCKANDHINPLDWGLTFYLHDIFATVLFFPKTQRCESANNNKPYTRATDWTLRKQQPAKYICIFFFS